MNGVLLVLGLLVFAISVGLTGWRLEQEERAWEARQWAERERLLGAPPKEINHRRARRGHGADLCSWRLTK